MPVIELHQLSKTYRVYQKQEGLVASLKGLFSREYRDVRAVRSVDLEVEQGEFVAFLGPERGRQDDHAEAALGRDHARPTGRRRVLGYVPWERDNAYRRRFALVMGQKNQLWWDLPAQESFRLHQQIYRDPARSIPADARRTDRAAEMSRTAQATGPRIVAWANG